MRTFGLKRVADAALFQITPYLASTKTLRTLTEHQAHACEGLHTQSIASLTRRYDMMLRFELAAPLHSPIARSVNALSYINISFHKVFKEENLGEPLARAMETLPSFSTSSSNRL